MEANDVKVVVEKDMVPEKDDTVMNMLKRGDSLESIAEVLDLSIETIKAWEQENIFS